MSTDLCDIHVEIQRCYNDSTTWRSRGDHVDVFAGSVLLTAVFMEEEPGGKQHRKRIEESGKLTITNTMATNMNTSIESLVREKVEDEPENISLNIRRRESRELSKTTKELSEVIVPDIAKIITVAVSAAVTSAVKDIISTYSDVLRLVSQTQ